MITRQKMINYYGGPLDGQTEEWSRDMLQTVEYIDGSGFYKRLPIFKDKKLVEYADLYVWYPYGKMIMYGPIVVKAAFQEIESDEA